MRATPAVAWGANTESSPSPLERQNRTASAVRSTTWLPRVSSRTSVLSTGGDARVDADLGVAHEEDLGDEAGPGHLVHAVALGGRGDQEGAPQRRGGEFPGSGGDEPAGLVDAVRAGRGPDVVVDRARAGLVEAGSSAHRQDLVDARAGEGALAEEPVNALVGALAVDGTAVDPPGALRARFSRGREADRAPDRAARHTQCFGVRRRPHQR